MEGGGVVKQKTAHEVNFAHPGNEHQGALVWCVVVAREGGNVLVELARALYPAGVRRVGDVYGVRGSCSGKHLRCHVVGKARRVKGGRHRAEVEIIPQKCDLHAHRQHQVCI